MRGFFALFLFFFFVPSGFAQSLTVSKDVVDVDPDWGYYLNFSLNSAYFFRGANLYDGLSFQPNIGVSYDFGSFGRLSGSVWSHLPLQEKDDDFEIITDLSELESPAVKFVELDTTLGYDITFGLATISAGHTWYTDPQEGRFRVRVADTSEEGPAEFFPEVSAQISRGDTSEFYLGFYLDTLLNPEITVIRDYRRFRYFYYTLQFSQPFTPFPKSDVVVEPFVLFGFTSGNVIAQEGDEEPRAVGFFSKNGFVTGTLGTSIQFDTKYFRMRPSINYVFGDRLFSGNYAVWIGSTFEF